MISFKILDSGEIEGLATEIADAVGCYRDEALEVLSSFEMLLDDDVEVGVSEYEKCILVRICDMGRYSFVYPILMSESADPIAAIEEIRAYAVREEIPLVLTDVPREDLGDILPMFRHTVVDAEDAQCESFRVRIESECSLLEEVPQIFGARVALVPVCEQDAPMMARLARDGETNKYWGYDYLSDVGDADDGYF